MNTSADAGERLGVPASIDIYTPVHDVRERSAVKPGTCPRSVRSGRGWRLPAATRTGSQRGQALIVALGAMFVVLLGAGVLAALGGALAQKGRLQRATDLAALSAARAMRDDFERLFEPPVIGGRLNPRHLALADYLARAREAALEAGRHNGLDLASGDVSFPGGGSGAPVRVKVKVKGRLPARGGDVPVAATATAELSPPDGEPLPLEASGSGYTGPLAYRQGKPMRPDVARAFDRMEAAARADGVRLIVTSGYRSDAEQAKLFARIPTRSGSRRPASRCTAGAPSSTSARRRPTAGWRATPSASTSSSATAGSRGTTATRSTRARRPTLRRGAGRPGDGRSAVPSFVPAAYRGADRARCEPLERVGHAARRAALCGERLQPVRGQSGGRARHRAVHARHGARLRPARTRSIPRPRSRPRRA